MWRMEILSGSESILELKKYPRLGGERVQITDIFR